MKKHAQLTIDGILDRKHFESAEIIAGHNGTSRIIKWVHVVEVTKIKNLLKGNELILSTGVAWKDRPATFLSMVNQLIECNAAGICLEIGTYMDVIPEDVIRLADEKQFPIIVFNQEVPFVEITQDLHTNLINQQYMMISELEHYSQSLNKQLLNISSYKDILKFLHEELGVQVIFSFKEQEPCFVPPVVKSQQAKWREAREQKNEEPFKNEHLITSPIYLFDQEYAELTIYDPEHSLNEFETLILDRTSTALAHHLLRHLYVEEKKRVEESKWIDAWLAGERRKEDIFEYLSELDIQHNSHGAVVCIFKLDCLRKNNEIDMTYYKLQFRSFFQQQGFQAFITEKNNMMIFILLNKRSKKTWKSRLSIVVNRMNESDLIKRKNLARSTCGIGKYVEDLEKVSQSFHCAEETIRIQDKVSGCSSYFYEDLHLYRIIAKCRKHIDLDEYISEYLSPVIKYDENYNGKLLETLKVYLSCNGSKKETAKKLYVVRQTLYHRLSKLEQLLGDDFMEPGKRLAIEFMIMSHEFITMNSQLSSKGAAQS
ncbi:PucR family transcriptional regulator [Falsibacillus albus]|uniref:PucR family transcriptional regulator n=1 Tax=Falsibacillus albus TaxID=2478915 RepID=A0A3L7K467_9BACI|nr:PucR family transcriptional regulator [Falsibacillus albus]RLQ95512.1 PucR family transcriptional regulator [Falsibacillus albus]